MVTYHISCDKARDGISPPAFHHWQIDDIIYLILYSRSKLACLEKVSSPTPEPLMDVGSQCRYQVSDPNDQNSGMDVNLSNLNNGPHGHLAMLDQFGTSKDIVFYNPCAVSSESRGLDVSGTVA